MQRKTDARFTLVLSGGRPRTDRLRMGRDAAGLEVCALPAHDSSRGRSCPFGHRGCQKAGVRQLGLSVIGSGLPLSRADIFIATAALDCTARALAHAVSAL